MLSRHRRAHRWIWLFLAIALPAIVLLALFVRPHDAAGFKPERISAPGVGTARP